jgi:hypothetical protein
MDKAQFLQEFLSWFKNRLNKNLHIDEWQRPLLVSLLDTLTRNNISKEL